jgi:hypothetical protein
MAKKDPSSIRNEAGGIDLLVERDAGNEIRILTGKKERSLEFWEKLRSLAEEIIDQLSTP